MASNGYVGLFDLGWLGNTYRSYLKLQPIYEHAILWMNGNSISLFLKREQVNLSFM